MISVEEVRRQVLQACRRLPAVEVPVADALACVLAETVTAAENVPPFDNTAMDGYALRADDTVSAPAPLEVVGTLAAGQRPDMVVGPGQAVRIMTGAPIPPGADAVVMVERTLVPPGTDAVVIVEITARPGDHIRRAGEDLRAGQVVFEPGTPIGPGHLGVLASLGRDRVSVFGRPRVGVLSTGDELVAGPEALAPGQIRDSNRPTLLAMVAEAGFEAADLGMVADSEDAIAAAIQEAVRSCDALVTSGGVSVGDFDHVKTVLDRLGEMSWWQVAVKPAKPLAFGVIDGVPVFGLPGNPVSSMVSFELFARPALRKMAGHSRLFRPHFEAVADEALARRPDGKLHLARVAAEQNDDGRWHVRPSGGAGSHLLWAMARANALALLPDGSGVEAGGTVEVMLVGEG
ncbi:MAG: molybdopterin molybdotransferase MoeA [Acidimicrobiales bacterium]